MQAQKNSMKKIWPSSHVGVVRSKYTRANNCSADGEDYNTYSVPAVVKTLKQKKNYKGNPKYDSD